MTDARLDAVRRLRAAGVDSPEAEALTLLGAATGLGRTDLLLHARRPLAAAEHAALERWLARREGREPLQHILGTAPFYGLELRVTPQVLVPRPETERLVELALTGLRGRTAPRLLDVGTGSGAIALAVKHERRDAQVAAGDISEEALAVARDNARRLGLEVAFVHSDLLAAAELAAFARRADVLLANPPYLPEGDRAEATPEVRRDPPLALYAGDDGLALFRRLERQAQALLPSGATMLVELDPRNAGRALAEASGWCQGRLHADLGGRRRFLELRR